jgi:hypothetical protein
MERDGSRFVVDTNGTRAADAGFDEMLLHTSRLLSARFARYFTHSRRSLRYWQRQALLRRPRRPPVLAAVEGGDTSSWRSAVPRARRLALIGTRRGEAVSGRWIVTGYFTMRGDSFRIRRMAAGRP